MSAAVAVPPYDLATAVLAVIAAVVAIYLAIRKDTSAAQLNEASEEKVFEEAALAEAQRQEVANRTSAYEAERIINWLTVQRGELEKKLADEETAHEDKMALLRGEFNRGQKRLERKVDALGAIVRDSACRKAPDCRDRDPIVVDEDLAMEGTD